MPKFNLKNKGFKVLIITICLSLAFAAWGLLVYLSGSLAIARQQLANLKDQQSVQKAD